MSRFVKSRKWGLPALVFVCALGAWLCTRAFASADAEHVKANGAYARAIEHTTTATGYIQKYFYVSKANTSSADPQVYVYYEIYDSEGSDGSAYRYAYGYMSADVLSISGNKVSVDVDVDSLSNSATQQWGSNPPDIPDSPGEVTMDWKVTGPDHYKQTVHSVVSQTNPDTGETLKQTSTGEQEYDAANATGTFAGDFASTQAYVGTNKSVLLTLQKD